MPHTGKLARSIILDLAVHDDLAPHDPVAEASWHRAVTRARWVVGRLGPDPDHGGLVFLPGRLDPRNASTSLIDAGECVDALATLARHPRFAGIDAGERIAVHEAIRGCAGTYLAATAGTKAIVNQVLWGAMGLAHACAVFPGEAAWREAVVRAVALAVARQRPDGSWGYEEAPPGAAGRRAGMPADHGSARAHPGVADLTVYYHGRCLAFLHHVIDHVPEADAGGRATAALRRGTSLLLAVRADDGTKSLALEGKRWFWASPFEVGSHAYDAYALARAAERFEDEEAGEAAFASWRSLQARVDAAGAVLAGTGAWPLGDAADLVCRDFHVADLAWVARARHALGPRAPVSPPGWWPGPGTPPPPLGLAGEKPCPLRRGGGPASSRVRVLQFPDAGVVRLEAGGDAAVLRVSKAPCNALWGGAAGGGTVVATATGVCQWRDAPDLPGSIAVRPMGTGLVARGRVAVAGVRRHLVANPPGREGRQLAFGWRVQARAVIAHAGAGFWGAACRLGVGLVMQAWRQAVTPFVEALDDVVTSHWALRTDDEGTAAVAPAAGAPSATWSGVVVPARRDGSVPPWALGVRIRRRISVDPTGVLVVDEVVASGPGHHPGGDTGARGPFDAPTLNPSPAAAGEGRTDARGPGHDLRVDASVPPGASQVFVRHGTGVEVKSGFLSPGQGQGGPWGAEPSWSGEPGEGWRVWQGGATVRAEVRPRRRDTPRPDGKRDGMLEVAYRLGT